MNIQTENKQLVQRHNILRKTLGYTFMRLPFHQDTLIRDTKTIEEDNELLKIKNRVYEECTTPQEANEKIDSIMRIRRQVSEL